MMTRIVTILIVGALLAGSAAACRQVSDVSLALAPMSATAESATSDRVLVFAVIPPANRFAASVGGVRQGARWIVVLKPRPSSAAD